MGNVVLENSIIIPCSRPEVYDLCVERKVHYLDGDEGDPLPVFLDCVKDRSWTEVVETPSESIRYSYVVYPVVDRTRLTVTAEFEPKGFARLTAGLHTAAREKREKARLAALRKSLSAHMSGETSTFL